MRLQISKTKNAASLYMVKSVYENGKRTSKVVEKLGTYADLLEKLHGEDPYVWAKHYVEEATRMEQTQQRAILVKYSPSKIISHNDQRSFNGGYLFLQQIYHQLGLDKICKEISTRHKFTYNLNSILSRLIYARMIYPASKLATCELSTKFIEPPDFELQHIYRALGVIAQETDLIQSAIYENSKQIIKRKTGIIYYDCTNYFFETEQADGIRQYGVSKEHRPNPIVQMGLFMDSDGIPLAFCLNRGNANEQTSLQPLEKKLLEDFKLSKFVVCTDAGVASTANRKFNDQQERAFITTQSIKKLKSHLKQWALAQSGWRLTADDKLYDLSKLTDEQCQDRVFYKERWINENGLEQKIVVTYSQKYRNYQRHIRHNQIERANNKIDHTPSKIDKCGANDYQRFIAKNHCTADGEVADQAVYGLNTTLIAEEEKYDGFYAVCTNLEDDAAKIIAINQRRWEIEECFRIMKSEFAARPVYLSRDDRITAHFTTCFLALIVYRLLEQKLDQQFTCPQIIRGLREMNFLKVEGEGYIPTYTRSDFTDKLHQVYGFRTDYEIVCNKDMKNICKITKS